MLEKVRVEPQILLLHFYSTYRLQMFLSYQVKIKNPYNQNPHKFYSNYITKVIHESARKVLHKQMTDAAF